MKSPTTAALRIIATLLTLTALTTSAKEEPLKIPPGAYAIEDFMSGAKNDFCVNDETNRFLSAQAWKAHFEKLGTKCDVAEVPATMPIEVNWRGQCMSTVFGKTVKTENKVRVLVMPAPHGFVISTESKGDVVGTVATQGKPAGACRPGMLVYKPWGL